MISIQYSENPGIRKAQKIGLWTVVGITGVIAFGLAFGFLIQFLWNATLSEMFGFPALSFWQAIGLFVLAKLFFGFGTGGGNSSQKQKKKGNEQAVDSEVEDVSALADDESFKKFWREEGKDAYESFLRVDENHEPDQT